MTVYRCVREVRYPKWDPNKLENSLVTVELLKFAEKKFLPIVAIVFLLKCLAMVSCKLKWPRFGVLVVAPTRQMKSYTSRVLKKIFDKIFWLDVLSDFTIHSLQKYKDKLKTNVCILVNDGTILFAALNKRTKDRLVGALAELFSDGRYVNQNFDGIVVDLEGQDTLILNLTSESFKNYKDRMLGLTFLERVLTVHYALSEHEKEIWVEKEQRTRNMKFNRKITMDDIETDVEEIPSHYLKLIKIRAKEFSYLSLRSFIGCQDVIKALVRAHAALNKRKHLCTDDFYFLSLIKPYLINPFNPHEGKMIKLRAQGLSYREICKAIGNNKKSHAQVKRVIDKAKIRGILPLEDNNE
jgi:hypothetical protein